MCVAEVIAFADAARDRQAESPDWFLGTIDWNGRRLPVVSFDSAQVEDRKTKRSRTRVVVFHALTDQVKGGFYGILTQGFPQLVRVNADVLTLDYRAGAAAGSAGAVPRAHDSRVSADPGRRTPRAHDRRAFHAALEIAPARLRRGAGRYRSRLGAQHALPKAHSAKSCRVERVEVGLR